MGDVYGSPAGHLEFQYTAHGALHLAQADLNGAAGIGHVLGAEDDQGAVAGAALGITGQLDLHDLAVGGLHRLVSGKNLGTGAGTVTDDADGAVLGVDVHLLVDLMVHVGGFCPCKANNINSL